MIVAVGAVSWQHFRQGVSSQCSVPQRHRCLSAVPRCKRGFKAARKVMENVEKKRMKGGSHNERAEKGNRKKLQCKTGEINRK